MAELRLHSLRAGLTRLSKPRLTDAHWRVVRVVHAWRAIGHRSAKRRLETVRVRLGTARDRLRRLTLTACRELVTFDIQVLDITLTLISARLPLSGLTEARLTHTWARAGSLVGLTRLPLSGLTETRLTHTGTTELGLTRLTLSGLAEARLTHARALELTRTWRIAALTAQDVSEISLGHAVAKLGHTTSRLRTSLRRRVGVAVLRIGVRERALTHVRVLSAELRTSGSGCERSETTRLVQRRSRYWRRAKTVRAW